MNIIKFDKYHGAGNDFIVLNSYLHDYLLSKEVIALMCHRQFGIGADGLIIVKKSPNSDFYMEYYNSDGQLATMCGNGGRVSVAFAFRKGIINKEITTFHAADGEHKAEIIDINDFQSVISLQLHVKDKVAQVDDKTFFVDTGSPHLCRFIENIESFDVYEEGRTLRYSSLVPTDGVNINFIQMLNDGIFVRTYERGVENETLSCGTGVVASALSFVVYQNAKNNQTISVFTRGGNFKVEYKKEQDFFKNIWLTGPVSYVFSGTYAIKKNR